MKNKETASTNNLNCPRCQLSHIKKNGHTYDGKQNYRCKKCGRQFVANSQLIGQSKRNARQEIIARKNIFKRYLSGLGYFIDVAT